MTISASSIAIGTAISVTGGTATGVISKGDSLNKHIVVLDDSSSFADQTTFTFNVKEPKVSITAPAGYTQARNSVVISRPLTLANGARTMNSVKIELAVDSETTDAQRDALRELAAQAIFDTDFDQYWNKQAIS